MLYLCSVYSQITSYVEILCAPFLHLSFPSPPSSSCPVKRVSLRKEFLSASHSSARSASELYSTRDTFITGLDWVTRVPSETWNSSAIKDYNRFRRTLHYRWCIVWLYVMVALAVQVSTVITGLIMCSYCIQMFRVDLMIQVMWDYKIQAESCQPSLILSNGVVWQLHSKVNSIWSFEND